jgi:hypothetical protein
MIFKVLKDKIEVFLTRVLDYNCKGCFVQKIPKPVDFPGQVRTEPTPVFGLYSDQGNLLAVVKVYPLVQGELDYAALFVRSVAIFKELQLTHSQTIDVLAIERIKIGGLMYSMCLMTPGEGESISQNIVKVGEIRRGTIERQNRMSKLHEVLSLWGRALGEFNAAKSRLNKNWHKEFLPNEQKNFQEFQETVMLYQNYFPFIIEEFQQAFYKMTQECSNLPAYHGMVHGDPVPHNFFYLAGAQKITFLDLDTLSIHVDLAGLPHGFVMKEFTEAKFLIERAEFFMQYTENEIADSKKSFEQGYFSMVNQEYYSPQLERYHYIIFSMKRMRWIIKVEERLKKEKTTTTLMYFSKYREFLVKSIVKSLNLG